MAVGGPDTRNVQVNLTANVSPYQRAIQDAGRATSGLATGVATLGRKIDDLVKSAGRKMTLLGASDIAGLVAAGEAANRLDVALQQVRATSAVTGQSVNAVRNSVMQLSRTIPDSTNNLARLAGEVQSLGIQGTQNIKNFTETAERLAAATNTAPGELLAGIIQLNRQMGSGLQTVNQYSSAIITLSKVSGTPASTITQFATEISSVAQVAGYTETQILGLAAAFSRAGADSSQAANVFTTITTEINEALVGNTSQLKQFADIVGMTTTQFKAMAQSNPARALTDILQAIHSQGQAGIITLQQLGLDGPRAVRVISSLTSGQANITQSMNASSQAYSQNTALTKSSNAAWDDLSSTMQKFRNNIDDIVTRLGGPMAHALNIMFEGLNTVIGPLNTFMGYLGPIPGIVAGIGGAFLAVTGVITTFSIAILAAAGAWRTLSGMTGTNALQGLVSGIRNPVGQEPFVNPRTILRQRPITGFDRSPEEGGRSKAARQIFSGGYGLGQRISAPPPEDPTLAQRVVARIGRGARAVVTYPVRRLGLEALEAGNTLGANYVRDAEGNIVRTRILRRPKIASINPRNLVDYEKRDQATVNPYSMLGFWQSGTRGAQRVRAAGQSMWQRANQALGRDVAAPTVPNPPPVTVKVNADVSQAETKIKEVREEASAPVRMPVPGVPGPGVSVGKAAGVAEEEFAGRTGGVLSMAGRGVGAAVGAMGTLASAVSSVALPLAILAPAGVALYHVFNSLHNSAQKAADNMDDFGTSLARTAGANYIKPSTTPPTVKPSDKPDPFGNNEKNTAVSSSFLAGNASDISRLRSYSGGSRKAAAQLMVQNVIANANSGQPLSPSEQTVLREQLIAAYGSDGAQQVYSQLNLKGVSPQAAGALGGQLLSSTRNDAGFFQNAFQGKNSSKQIMNAVTPIANNLADNPAQAALGLIGLSRALPGLPSTHPSTPNYPGAKGGGSQIYYSGSPDVLKFQQGAADIITQLNKGQSKDNQIHINTQAVFNLRDFVTQLKSAGGRAAQFADNLEHSGLNLNDLSGSVQNLTHQIDSSAQTQQSRALGRSKIGRLASGAGIDLGIINTDVNAPRNIAYLTNQASQTGLQRAAGKMPSPIDQNAIMRAIDAWRQYRAGLAQTDPAFQAASQEIDRLNGELSAQTSIFETAGQQASGYASQALSMIANLGTSGAAGADENQLIQQAQGQIASGEATLKGYVTQVHEAHIQMANAEQDYNLQMSHMYRDFNIQQKEALYQRNRQVKESNYEFSEQLRQMKYQTADVFGNAAQMVQSQYTEGAGSALIGMTRQVSMLQRSKDTMDRLHQMGLSRNAIRVLGLDDPNNVEQAQRYMANFAANPKMIDAFNKSIKNRLKISNGIDTDINNSKFAEMQRQFHHTADMATQAFTHSQEQTRATFNRELADFEQQYSISVSREMQQLNEIGQNLYTSWNALDKAAMDTGLRHIQHYADGINHAINKVKRATESYNQAQNAPGPHSTVGVQRPGKLGRFLWAEAQQESGDYGAVNKSSGALGKYQVLPSNVPEWSRRALGHSITPQEFLHSPALQEQIVGYILGGYFKKYGASGAASAWYSGNPNLAGSNAPVSGGPSIHEYVLHVLSLMHQAPKYHHGHRHKKPVKGAHAEGGIALEPHVGLVAEAGNPEALIPLNARGVSFMAQVMATTMRSTGIGPTSYAMSRSSSYASPVTNIGTVNNTFDHSTTFDGHWTVQAQNPDELARQLQQRKRLSALSRPVARNR